MLLVVFLSCSHILELKDTFFQVVIFLVVVRSCNFLLTNFYLTHTLLLLVKEDESCPISGLLTL